MSWRVKSFFSDAQAEDYLNSVALEPSHVRDVHPVVQGPRTGLRIVCWLDETQVEAENEWLRRTQAARPGRSPAP